MSYEALECTKKTIHCEWQEGDAVWSVRLDTTEDELPALIAEDFFRRVNLLRGITKKQGPPE